MILSDLVGRTISKITGDRSCLQIYFDKDSLEINIEINGRHLEITTVKKEKVTEVREITYDLFDGIKV